MRWRWLTVALVAGCAPIRVGPGRVLPPALQYDPASFAAKAVERTVEPARRLTLPNGLEIFWAEDHAAPLVDVSVLVGCGRGDEPVGVPELTAAAFSLAFSAGAGELDGAAQRRALAELGLEPDLHFDDGESWGFFTVRSEDLPAAVSLIKDALAAPRFEASGLTQELQRWAARFDAPGARHERLARRTRSRAIYGNVPTLSQVATAATMRAITQDQVRTHAGLCMQASNLVLTVSGDVTESSLQAALAPLSTLRGGAAMKHLPPAPLPTARWVWLVPSRLPNKVTVEFVGPGLTPGTPNRAAAEVLMAGLLSRLQGELRNQMGHIYSTDGDIEVGPGSGATWFRFTTRSEVALEAVRRALAIVQSWWERWPFDDEITAKLVEALRKDHARTELARRTFQTARARLQDKAGFEAASMDEQFARVKMDDVRAIFSRALRPDRLQVVVSGTFDATLDWEQFGPATRLQPVP